MKGLGGSLVAMRRAASPDPPRTGFGSERLERDAANVFVSLLGTSSPELLQGA
jgi:hypothetical protein